MSHQLMDAQICVLNKSKTTPPLTLEGFLKTFGLSRQDIKDYRVDSSGYLHSINPIVPAIKLVSGDVGWYDSGILHRDNAAAWADIFGYLMVQQGVLHNDKDEPSILQLRHRSSFPREMYNSQEEYYKNGKLHHEKQPALIRRKEVDSKIEFGDQDLYTVKIYYLNGDCFRQGDLPKIELEQLFRNKVVMSKLVWTNKKGQIHRKKAQR